MCPAGSSPTPLFAERTLELIDASAVPVEQVVLELTESVLLDRLDYVDPSLRRLRDAGLQLALDDFGSGYSSLNYLRRYPVSVLKLDTTYTQRLTSEADTRIIAEAITMMADRLGLMVVAEGVETKEHLEVVRELGIMAQGYLLGRPHRRSTPSGAAGQVRPASETITIATRMPTMANTARSSTSVKPSPPPLRFVRRRCVRMS